ncbi:MAG: hypothetical protein KC464_13515, partial [Myxococcales bacterium]|nr:hypothetical protein [Myxococcales bacterium]
MVLRAPRVLLALAGLAVLSATPRPARADYAVDYAPPPKPPEDDFWREVVEPHGDQIRVVLEKVDQIWNQVVSWQNYDAGDPTGELRQRVLDDAWGMLKYARRLDPTRRDVLERMGRIGEESGRTQAAIEALQAYVALLPPEEDPPAEISLRLGRSMLRAGRAEDAMRHLRAAASPAGIGAQALAALGEALMQTGRTADAIDALSPNLGQQYSYYWQNETVQLAFTLAVAYDRDEQITAAFGVLEDMRNQLATEYANRIQQSLAALPLVPARDREYFLALFYESEGYLQEARTEWLHYAEGGDGAPFRGRALDHVAAIDQLLAERLEAAAKPKP